MSTIVKFRFSSWEHPGCRIFASKKEIDNIAVVAEQDVMVVHEPGTSNSFEEKGPTRVQGTIAGKDLDPCENQQPFDVTVLAYSPLEDRDYQLKILNVYMTDEESFSAVAILPWKAGTFGVGTCRLEDVGSLEIPAPKKVVKGEIALKPEPKGWHLQDDADKNCRWLGSSDRFDPIATFHNDYGTKLQVVTDDNQFVLAICNSEEDVYKMTYWWPPEVLKKFADRFCWE